MQCPYCRQTIPALTLTDTYLCHRHGAFEADPKTGDLVHLYTQGYRATKVIIAHRYRDLVSAYRVVQAECLPWDNREWLSHLM